MARIVSKFENEWNPDILNEVYKVIENIAVKEWGYEIYPNQIEIISAEGMLEAYATVGLPLMYTHWSFGKRYLSQSKMYKAGLMGLAYEIVINSNPCISYLMEGNTLAMQTLVMAHACVSGDTEYLSPTGWRRMDQYDGGLVAQFDKNNTVNFVEPSKYTKRSQDRFIHVRGSKVEQKITDDHRVVFINENGNLIEITGEELKSRQENKTRGFNGRFISGFTLVPDAVGVLEEALQDANDDEIRLAIAIKADGSYHKKAESDHFNCVNHHRVRFHLKKTRKIKRLEGLLKRLAIEYTKSSTHGGRVAITFNIRHKIEKRYTSGWYGATWDQLQVIADEVLYWDGSPEYKTFSSKHKEDVDFVQFVWASTGKHTNLRRDIRCWSVHYTDNPLVGVGTDRGDIDFPYVPSEDGFAYCFTVPSGMFVTRLNNKISVTGNCMGHNHFFANNYLFKQWTQPESIIDYLGYARRYIERCEDRYGIEAVETILDAAHTVSHYSVDKYHRVKKTAAQLDQELRRRIEWEESQYDPIFSPFAERKKEKDQEQRVEPTENLLYFIEKNAPNLEVWQREIIRIVRKVGQYFYPQGQLQLMNEGFATATHYEMSWELYDRGYADDAFVAEFIDKHSAVLYSPPAARGSPLKHLNPYKLGFELFMDIKRRCQKPTKEDEYYFPDQIERPYREVWFEAVRGFKDESFIEQFLSPAVVRKMQLMSLYDSDQLSEYRVSATASDESFLHLRTHLSRQYDWGSRLPQISIFDVDWKGNRRLMLRHDMQSRRPLDDNDTRKVLSQIYKLWQYPITVESYDGKHGKSHLTYP